jgi:HD superfamily phosphohydrolase YqeK
LTILADKIEFERKIEVVHKFKPNNLKKLSMYVDPLLKPYAGKIEKVDSSLKIEQIKSEVKL